MSFSRSPVSTQPSIYSPRPVYHPNVRSPSLHSQTLSDYGSSGKSSLVPPLTRGPSAVTSYCLPTPFEDPPLARRDTVARYYSDPSSFGKDTPQARIATPDTAPETPTRRYDVPLGQRIILGTSSVVAPRMQRRRSAKELITQCEERDSSAHPCTPPASQPTPPHQRSASNTSLARRNAQLPPVPPAADPPRAPPSHCVPDGQSYFSTFARSRGKMRSSFTSLIQILGDKAKSRDREKDNLKTPVPTSKRSSISPSSLRAFNALPRGFMLKLGKRGAASPDKVETRQVALPNMNELLATEPIKSGLVLYQSPARQNQHDSTTPWMPYTVSLYPSSIILQIPNPTLVSTSSRFQIPISEVWDVHSIASKELPPGFVVPPPDFRLQEGEEELYVFQVGSFGERVERFAVGGWRERQEWVSLIMDAMSGVDGGNGRNEGDGLSFTVDTSHTPTTGPKLDILPTRSVEPPRTTGDTSSVSAAAPSKTVSVLSSPWELAGSSAVPGPVRSTPTRAATQHRLSHTATEFGSQPPPSQTVFTNPPRTPSRTMSPQSPPSRVMSPRSIMTASPSICRLDERSLVRNRLAMFEQQSSPSPSSAGLRPGSLGLINWDALSEVRGARPGSVVGGRSNGRSSERGSSFGPGLERFESVSSRRGGPSSPPVGNSLLFRPGWATSKEKLGAATSLFSHLVGPAVDSPPTLDPPIQVLGNIPNGKGAQPPSNSIDTSNPSASFSLVSERIASLTAALRESDVAHSTKASGLGQLVASTQDHIIQALEENTQVLSREHSVTTGHLERLHEEVRALAKQPDTEAQLKERVDTLAVKEALERVAKGVEEGAGGMMKQDEMREVLVQKLDQLKDMMNGFTERICEPAKQDDIMAKLEALGSAPSVLDPTLVGELAEHIKAHISALDLPAPNMDVDRLVPDISGLSVKLDEIAAALNNGALQVDLTEIRKTLEEIKERSLLRKETDAPDSISDAGPVDLSDVLMKIDGVHAMFQSFTETKSGEAGEDESAKILKQEANEKLQQLLAALREDAEHRTTQAEQTSELIRYSHELNTWLEKFVTNASTQMDNAGAGMSTLRRDLGLDPPLPVTGQENDPAPPGALEQLRTLIADQSKTVEGVGTTLNALVTSINEDQMRNAETRQKMATDAVLKMIDLQRQEQEQLLKKLASDLSSDIRGERIRFVEAMSQATSMNIQLHVDEFKKQLTHEVLTLTDEVSRLRDERKTIQHQIAQLFLIKSDHEAENGPQPPKPVSNTRPGT